VHSLRGQLLVAGPGLRDPNFRRTVVLLGEHGDEGAMGVVLNRVSTVSVDDAVPPVAELVGPEALVHIGGPV
jgi:putative transcriptional regulator